MLKDFKTTQERKDNVLQTIKEWDTRCTDKTMELGSLQRCETAVPRFQLTNTDPDEAGTITLSTHAEGQLFGRLNMPGSYIHRCPHSLQATNVNHWIQENKDRKILARFIDDKVRAIFSTRHSGKEMDDVKIFPIVLEVLETQVKDGDINDLHLKDFLKSEDFTQLRVFYKHLKSEKHGLTYFAGITIVNSEIGKSSIWIKPTIRSGSQSGMYDFIDRSHEGSTSVKHVGELKEDRIRKAVVEAKKVAEIGIARLMETSNFIIDNPGQNAADFIQQADFLPNRLSVIIEEEYKDIMEASKLAVAQSILSSVKNLPTFQRYLAEGEVGRYLDLFRDSKNRLQSIIAAQNA